MGFPEKNPDGPNGAAFMDYACVLKTGGYTCNRCKARISDLPCECHVCGLTLVSSPHIARAYHHLFPVRPFEEVASSEVGGLSDKDGAGVWEGGSGARALCFGCRMDLLVKGAGMVLRCPGCGNLFCFDCDAFVHESLHNCPGCVCTTADATNLRIDDLELDDQTDES